MSNEPLPQETPAQYLSRIGAKGGSRNSEAQQKARMKPKKGAGRPRKPETVVIPKDDGQTE